MEFYKVDKVTQCQIKININGCKICDSFFMSSNEKGACRICDEKIIVEAAKEGVSYDDYLSKLLVMKELVGELPEYKKQSLIWFEHKLDETVKRVKNI